MMIKTDKILHFLCGYAISVTIGIWLPVLGLCAGVIAGAGKELIYDKAMKKGTPEWADFLYTLGGSCLGFIVAMVHAKIL